MPKTYCVKCGHPNSYASTQPKYCANCGNKFATLSFEKKLTPKNTENAEENEEFSGVDHIPNITKLDFDFLDIKKHEITIKDIIGTSEPSQLNQNNTQLEPIRENFLDSFKAEAGAIRPKNRNFKNNANKKG